MKHFKRIISLVLCILILFVACLSVAAKTVYPVGDWVYEKINNNTEFEVDEYIGDSTYVSTLYTHNSIPITSIGEYAFSSNSIVETVKLRNTVYAVQNFAFSDCSALAEVILTGSIKLIGSGAFMGCTSLTTINLQDTVIPAVNSSTFMNCDSLKSITLPATVKSIDAYAFAACDSLSKITIPASVTAIDDNAFTDSDKVVIYCYTNSKAHIYALNKGIDFVLLDAQPTQPTVAPTQPTTPPTTPPTVPVGSYMLGDADCDNAVSVLDATTIQRLLASLISDDNGKITIHGNVDGDELLSIMDATLIQRYIASYDDGYEIGNIFEY